MKNFAFNLEKTKSKARAGQILTTRGVIQTPIFMPVGTLGTVKSLDTQDILDTKAQIILGNTYHLYLRPGMEKLSQLGGLHQFMGWQKPILTDSGGFQVFSLGKQQQKKDVQKKEGGGRPPAQAVITDDGVGFTSHLDGSKHYFTPETSIEIQRQIGADIIMAFDECTPEGESEAYTRQALDRTHQWAEKCANYWEEKNRLSAYGQYQALFGIIQGALYPEMRRESAQFITSLPFDGIAVGGETVGYNMKGTADVMQWIGDILPTDKPRYAMGLGRDPQDIVDATLMGFDMFDCVGPTRLARNGTLFVGKLEIIDGLPQFVSQFNKARLQIGNAISAKDNQIIQTDCDCYTCKGGYSRAYLNHLFRSKELTYYRLASIHNIRTMIRISEQLREWILS